MLKLFLKKQLYLILLILHPGPLAFAQIGEFSKANSKVYIRQGEVKMYANRPTIFINEKPVTPLLYSLVNGIWSWNEKPELNIKQFCKIAGVNLVQADIYLDQIWFPDGSIRLDTAIKQIRGVLNVCPDAGVFFRLHVNAPRWWQAQNPDESIVYGDTVSKWKGVFSPSIMGDDVSNVARFSLASKKWRTSASEAVQKFCKQLAKTPEGNALVSIQVASGVYGEWHYFGFLDHDPDRSEPMTEYFRNWLKKKYKTDKALREAWGKNEISLQTVEVPGTKERNTTGYGVFRDPAKERNVIDYFEAQHLVVAEDILHFCKVIKESWPRPIITGSFYGYFYSLFGRAAAGGHLAIDTVLNSPYIDFLAGPHAYYPDIEAIGTGDPYHSRGLLKSVRLHNKLWLEENDQEPLLLSKSDSNYDASVKESIAIVRRNIMYTASKGMGMWFYDFGLRKEGYWNQPDIMNDLGKLKSVLDKNLSKPYVSDADVLMVYDTRSFYSLVSQTNKTNITNILINWTSINTMSAGVVFDAIYLNDLRKVDLSGYKVIIFNNTFVLDEGQLKFITNKVMKDNRDIIWFYAPGYSNDTELNVDHMSKLTGINLVEANSSTLPIIKTTKLPGEPFTYDIRRERNDTKSREAVLAHYQYADYDAPYLPLFEVNDRKAITLGVYVSNNKTAIAKKKLPLCTSWYVALPAYETGLMRGLLNGTSAHIFCSEDSVIVYSGGGLLSVHSKERGIKSITLSNGKLIKLNMEKNSTFILNNQTGEVIMGNIKLSR